MSQSKKETKELKDDECKKRSKKKNKTITGRIVQDPKPTENFLSNYSVLERQVNFIGDSYDSLTPKSSLFMPEAEVTLEDIIKNTTSFSYNEIKQMKRLKKINQVSKYTVSLDILSTKADGILQFLDELNKTPMMHSNQLQKTVSTRIGPQYNGCNVRCGSKEKKSKNHCSRINSAQDVDLCQCLQTSSCLMYVDSEEEISHLKEIEFSPMMNSTSSTQDADSCFCLQTNRNFMSFDSEEDIKFTEKGIFTKKHFVCDVSYSLQDELLTPEELESVDTGSDDNWLYTPMQYDLISVSV